MPKFPMDLSKFRKTGQTDKKTTMTHDDGHVIFIAHGRLKPDMKKALDALPLAKGGKVKKMADGGEVAEPDPQKAKEMQAGATQSGWQPKQWAKNVKEGLGMAGGGVASTKTKGDDGETSNNVASTFVGPPKPVQKRLEDMTDPAERAQAVHSGFTKNYAGGGRINPELTQLHSLAKKHGYSLSPTRMMKDGGRPEDAPLEETLPPLEVEQMSPEEQMPQSSAPEAQPQVEAVAPMEQETAQAAAPQPEAPMAPEQEAPTPEQAPQPAAPTSKPMAKMTMKPETVETVNEAPVAKRSISAQMHAEDDALAQDMASGQITPKTYSDLFASRSTLGKVGTIFGLLVSGMGSGLSHQPNALLKMMDKTIDRDLDAQKTSAGNRQNFYKIRQQQLINEAQNRLTHAQAETSELGNKATRYGLNQAGILGSGVTQDKNGKVTLTPAGEMQARTQAKMDLYNAAAHDLESKVAKMSPNHPLYAATVGALQDLHQKMSLEKQQMTSMVDKAHQVEEDANDPIAKITGTSRSQLPPLPEVSTLLHPDADKKIMGLSAAAAGSPMFKQTFEPLLQQYNAAKQADEVLKDLPKTFQDLSRLRHWSQRVAGPLASLAPAVGGAAGAGLGARSGNPMGGAYVGEGVGEGLKQGLKAVAGTEQNRLYDATVSKLGGIIMNARIPNLGHEEAMRWASQYAPVSGDSDQAINWKLSQLADKIRISVPRGLLDAQGFTK